ncbi:hypothetical protein ACFWVC_13160 [Streptomyces sp. NPDC058691]|uniref:hypothetical protein n=1 Tax=Streptomyces sp. NPDC058691 TaxID=3346601 RepID=UPI0036516CE7
MPQNAGRPPSRTRPSGLPVLLVALACLLHALCGLWGPVPVPPAERTAAVAAVTDGAGAETHHHPAHVARRAAPHAGPHHRGAAPQNHAWAAARDAAAADPVAAAVWGPARHTSPAGPPGPLHAVLRC